jgi:hypothetical protein
MGDYRQVLLALKVRLRIKFYKKHGNPADMKQKQAWQSLRLERSPSIVKGMNEDSEQMIKAHGKLERRAK